MYGRENDQNLVENSKDSPMFLLKR